MSLNACADNGALQPAEPKLDAAVRKWTEKYGEDVAAYLEGLVEESMPHYEYLHQRKL